jgi:hypothetical protein
VTTRTYAPYPFAVGDNKTGQCSACGRVFFGETAFDAHRRGGVCLDPYAPPVREDGSFEPWWRDAKTRWHFGERMAPEVRARMAANRSHTSTQGCETTLPGVSDTPQDSGASQGGARE